MKECCDNCKHWGDHGDEINAKPRAGDVVEVLKNGEWLSGIFSQSGECFTVEGFNFGTGGLMSNADELLRMKYPSRIKSG